MIWATVKFVFWLWIIGGWVLFFALWGDHDEQGRVISNRQAALTGSVWPIVLWCAPDRDNVVCNTLKGWARNG